MPRPRMSDENYRILLDLADRVGWPEILAEAEDLAADLAVSAEHAGRDDEIVAAYNRASAAAGRAWAAFLNAKALAGEPTGKPTVEATAGPMPCPAGDDTDLLNGLASTPAPISLADRLHAGTLTPGDAELVNRAAAWQAAR